MSLNITSLNSGSNGNCYYIGNEHDAVLIDAGISCRETEKRLCRLNLDIKKVKAVFVSHEHGDHIRGVAMLSKKYRIPVYITPLTLVHGGLELDQELTLTFTAYQPVHIGSLAVTAFPKFHDAPDPHSFIVESAGIKIGVFTDIGAVCGHVTHHFSQCHAAFLEANYDEAMLNNGAYPYHLKHRITGGKGHLSNIQAFNLFVNYRPGFMSHLILSHLSKNNNCPQLVHSLFSGITTNTNIVVASRFVETAVYQIGNGTKERHGTMTTPEYQLDLFG